MTTPTNFMERQVDYSQRHVHTCYWTHREPTGILMHGFPF